MRENKATTNMTATDPTGITAIFTALGKFFQFGSDLSASINEWFNKVGIPGAELASVNRRLRICKWILNHYPSVKVSVVVDVKFSDQSQTMRSNICELLMEETGRTTYL